MSRERGILEAALMDDARLGFIYPHGRVAEQIRRVTDERDAAVARAEAAEAKVAAVEALADDLRTEVADLRADVPPQGPPRVAHMYRMAGLSDAHDRLRAALATPHDGEAT